MNSISIRCKVTGDLAKAPLISVSCHKIHSIESKRKLADRNSDLSGGIWDFPEQIQMVTGGIV
ncbi:MAG TPA: hypothetical protein VK798_14085, partial [Alloacidobacterium sp.]|nr:hypothetical protein [Alloacidobacterium sp.]